MKIWPCRLLSSTSRNKYLWPSRLLRHQVRNRLEASLLLPDFKDSSIVNYAVATRQQSLRPNVPSDRSFACVSGQLTRACLHRPGLQAGQRALCFLRRHVCSQQTQNVWSRFSASAASTLLVSRENLYNARAVFGLSVEVVSIVIAIQTADHRGFATRITVCPCMRFASRSLIGEFLQH